MTQPGTRQFGGSKRWVKHSLCSETFACFIIHFHGICGTVTVWLLGVMTAGNNDTGENRGAEIVQ